jgi:hypothetical protein
MLTQPPGSGFVRSGPNDRRDLPVDLVAAVQQPSDLGEFACRGVNLADHARRVGPTRQPHWGGDPSAPRS